MFEIAGIALLPEWPLFAAFVLAGLALNIVPGADMAFVIASAARAGRRGGIIASLGIGTGALVHVFAAVVGLSALLAASQAAFNLIKWAGAAYLLWIAIGLIRSGSSVDDAAAATVPIDSRRIFRSAMMVNILNPKVALFFLAFLPQFVDTAAAVPELQVLCLGLWFIFAGTLVNIAVALAAAGVAARAGRSAWLASAGRWIAATVLGGLAVQLAISRRPA